MMSKKLKRILSAITVCALVLTFALFAIATEEDESIDPEITDGDVTDGETDAPVAVESMKFTTSSYSMLKGDSVQTELKVTPDDATGYSIEYSTSNKKVATVDENGLIKAVGKGEATITAKCGEITCTATVTVLAVDLYEEQDHTMEKYVGGFAIGMTIDSAKAAFAKFKDGADVADVKIFSNSSEPSGNALIATGMTIEFGEGVYYNVVVAGDVDGSGTITYDDAKVIVSVLSGGAFDNTACEKAAKFNGNDELSIKTALDMSDYVSKRLTLED